MFSAHRLLWAKLPVKLYLEKTDFLSLSNNSLLVVSPLKGGCLVVFSPSTLTVDRHCDCVDHV